MGGKRPSSVQKRFGIGASDDREYRLERQLADQPVGRGPLLSKCGGDRLRLIALSIWTTAPPSLASAGFLLPSQPRSFRCSSPISPSWPIASQRTGTTIWCPRTGII